MEKEQIYQIIIGVLVAGIVFLYIAFVSPSMKTKKNYKNYLSQAKERLKEINMKNHPEVPITTQIGEAYMKFYRSSNCGTNQPYGLKFKKPLIDFLKVYFDNNPDKVLAVGFGITDATLLRAEPGHPEDPQAIPARDKKYSLILGEMPLSGGPMHPFVVLNSDLTFYDDWNDVWP